ncbi:MAG: transposase [Thermodesulfobacteriota bacterium]|nr:transposase [Thermodesulfobacteriota bacterium]
MNTYSKELKESIIARMLPPSNISVPELVRETGIPKDTLYSWRSRARKGCAPEQSNASRELSSEEKFNIVLETASLNELELGEYCRRKGLFSQMINAWRETCKQAHAPLAPKTDRTTIRTQKKVIKRLEGELRYKEKALAEAAALLILKKKSGLSGRIQREKNRPYGAH